LVVFRVDSIEEDEDPEVSGFLEWWDEKARSGFNGYF
jgi:hypothetical protein